MTSIRTFSAALLTVLAIVSAGSASADHHGKAADAMASGMTEGTVEHIVLFRFKEDVTDAQIQEVTERFVALETSERNGKPYILDIQYGTQNSKEGVARGYELGFIVSFKTLEDRDFYVGRPFIEGDDYDLEHDAFKEFVGPLLAEENGVLVFDFTDGDAETPAVE